MSEKHSEERFFYGFSARPLLFESEMWSFTLVSAASSSCSLLSDDGWEATVFRHDEAQTQAPKEEEEEGSQRAHQACVGLRPLLQRHPGSHQGTESQCHLWRRIQDRGLHVGRAGGGAEAGMSQWKTEINELSLPYWPETCAHECSVPVFMTCRSFCFNRLYLLFSPQSEKCWH